MTSIVGSQLPDQVRDDRAVATGAGRARRRAAATRCACARSTSRSTAPAPSCSSRSRHAAPALTRRRPAGTTSRLSAGFPRSRFVDVADPGLLQRGAERSARETRRRLDGFSRTSMHGSRRVTMPPSDEGVDLEARRSRRCRSASSTSTSSSWPRDRPRARSTSCSATRRIGDSLVTQLRAVATDRGRDGPGRLPDVPGAGRQDAPPAGRGHVTAGVPASPAGGWPPPLSGCARHGPLDEQRGTR